MQVFILIVMAVVFTVVLAVGQSAYWAYVAKKEREQQELVRRLGMMSDQQAESLFRQRARDNAAAALGKLGSHLQQTIEQADSTWQVSTLLAQMAIIGLLGAVVFYWLIGIPGLILAFIAGLTPYFYLLRAGIKRTQMLVEQLPEALDLMARSLQAGLGLNEAFRTCAEEMPLPIAAEFGRVFEEVRFGRDYRDAFGNMLNRNPGVFDLRLFVSSVLLQRETGGNLIEILDSIAGTIRGRFLFMAKVRALTSEARFSALILGGLPLAVAILLMVSNPEYLSPLFTDPLGNVFLGYFFSSYALGGFLMYHISKVEV